MRLLNFNTFGLREFIESERPPYIILSHTWGAEEVSLQELHNPNIESKAGYVKILNFAQKGKDNGFEWGWVDTCCIDKTSSAELSEAINSMYRWYAEAESCYAYLSDVFGPEEGVHLEPSTMEQFAGSRLFTRGWTLQELLEPSSVVFYLSDWTIHGTKSSLNQKISRITKIPASALTDPTNLGYFTVAQRISWASKRQTTRQEDLSYCLLGILDVHMPLLYGEGTRAFKRLQEEVMKSCVDSTIFAWPTSALPFHTMAEVSRSFSLLAPSPAAFRHAGKHRISDPATTPGYGPWSITNRGIRIEGLPVFQGYEADALMCSAGFQLGPKGVYAIALLGCFRAQEEDHRSAKQFGIALYKHGDIYYRFRTPESLLLLDSGIKSSARVDSILRLAGPSYVVPTPLELLETVCIIRELPETQHGFRISEICVRGEKPEEPGRYKIFSSKDLGYDAIKSASHQAIIFSNDATKQEFFVIIRIIWVFPWISLLTNTTRHELNELFLEKSPFSSFMLRKTYVDRHSKPLQERKEVSATVVRGMKDGNRVLFLDTCIRDVI